MLHREHTHNNVSVDALKCGKRITYSIGSGGYFTASPVRARERQIRAPKKHILGGLSTGSYSDRVTVYPYNGHIKSTNPVV